MKYKIQNIIKSLRDIEEEEDTFWGNIPENDDLENYLNQEEPNDDDLREKE